MAKQTPNQVTLPGGNTITIPTFPENPPTSTSRDYYTCENDWCCIWDGSTDELNDIPENNMVYPQADFAYSWATNAFPMSFYIIIGTIYIDGVPSTNPLGTDHVFHNGGWPNYCMNGWNDFTGNCDAIALLSNGKIIGFDFINNIKLENVPIPGIMIPVQTQQGQLTLDCYPNWGDSIDDIILYQASTNSWYQLTEQSYNDFWNGGWYVGVFPEGVYYQYPPPITLGQGAVLYAGWDEGGDTNPQDLHFEPLDDTIDAHPAQCRYDVDCREGSYCRNGKCFPIPNWQPGITALPTPDCSCEGTNSYCSTVTTNYENGTYDLENGEYYCNLPGFCQWECDGRTHTQPPKSCSCTGNYDYCDALDRNIKNNFWVEDENRAYCEINDMCDYICFGSDVDPYIPGIDTEQSRIADGVEVDPPGKYPFQVSLQLKQYNDKHVCGGTLLDSQWVLTAAHCVDSRNIDSYQVVVGLHDISDPPHFGKPGAGVYNIINKILHPEYLESNFGDYYTGYAPNLDFALVRLQYPVEEFVNWAPISLTSGLGDNIDGIQGTITGWGSTTNAWGESSDVLMEGSVEVNESCGNWHTQMYNDPITDNMICLTGVDGDAYACNNDSGGPFFINTGTEESPIYEQVGVTSWGKTVCSNSSSYPSIYARIDSVDSTGTSIEDWITDVINNPPPPEVAVAPCTNIKDFLEILNFEHTHCWPNYGDMDGDGILDRFSFLDYYGEGTDPNDNPLILLDLSSSNCGPCAESIPYLDELIEVYGSDIQIVTELSGIGAPYTCEQWGNFSEYPDEHWILNANQGMAIYRDFFSNGTIPTFILIDKYGYIMDIAGNPQSQWTKITVDTHGDMIDAMLESDVSLCEECYVNLWGYCYSRSVTAIDLSNFQLEGPIPPEIGLLTELYTLKLNYNNITGPIPPEMGNLTKLRFLEIHNNQLTGPIPPELGNLLNLKQLVINDNRITGPLPNTLSPTVGNMVSLQKIDASNNLIQGIIPGEIFDYGNYLVTLDLRNNLLGPALPDNLCNNMYCCFAGFSQYYFHNNHICDVGIPDCYYNTGMTDYALGEQGSCCSGYTCEDGSCAANWEDCWEIIDDPDDDPEEGGLLLGDLNQDGIVNVVDVLMVIYYVLDPETYPLTELEQTLADFNEDGIIDILDIIDIIDVIVGGEWGVPQSEIDQIKNLLYMVSNGQLDINTISNLPSKIQSEYTEYTLQTISLTKGWNMISLNVLPVDSSFIHINGDNKVIGGLLYDLINEKSLIKVRSNTGDITFGKYWMNGIGNIKLTEGYHIQVKKPTKLFVYGIPISLPLTIQLKEGWNIISYPAQLQQNSLDILQQLIGEGSLIKVIDQTGSVIEYSSLVNSWINEIGNFKPGEGYYIKVNTQTELSIQEGDILPIKFENNIEQKYSQNGRPFIDPEEFDNTDNRENIITTTYLQSNGTEFVLESTGANYSPGNPMYDKYKGEYHIHNDGSMCAGPHDDMVDFSITKETKKYSLPNLTNRSDNIDSKRVLIHNISLDKEIKPFINVEDVEDDSNKIKGRIVGVESTKSLEVEWPFNFKEIIKKERDDYYKYPLKEYGYDYNSRSWSTVWSYDNLRPTFKPHIQKIHWNPSIDVGDTDEDYEFIQLYNPLIWGDASDPQEVTQCIDVFQCPDNSAHPYGYTFWLQGMKMWTASHTQSDNTNGYPESNPYLPNSYYYSQGGRWGWKKLYNRFNLCCHQSWGGYCGGNLLWGAGYGEDFSNDKANYVRMNEDDYGHDGLSSGHCINKHSQNYLNEHDCPTWCFGSVPGDQDCDNRYKGIWWTPGTSIVIANNWDILDGVNGLQKCVNLFQWANYESGDTFSLSNNAQLIMFTMPEGYGGDPWANDRRWFTAAYCNGGDGGGEGTWCSSIWDGDDIPHSSDMNNGWYNKNWRSPGNGQYSTSGGAAHLPNIASSFYNRSYSLDQPWLLHRGGVSTVAEDHPMYLDSWMGWSESYIGGDPGLIPDDYENWEGKNQHGWKSGPYDQEKDFCDTYPNHEICQGSEEIPK